MDFRKIRQKDNDTRGSGHRFSTFPESYKMFFALQNPYVFSYHFPFKKAFKKDRNP